MIRIQVIYHVLGWLFFSIGFMAGFLVPIKKRKHLIFILLFLTGLGFGMYEHITFQDEWGYSREDYRNLILDVKERPVNNPWRHAICLVIYNDNSICPGRSDQRWEVKGYFGEKLQIN